MGHLHHGRRRALRVRQPPLRGQLRHRLVGVDRGGQPRDRLPQRRHRLDQHPGGGGHGRREADHREGPVVDGAVQVQVHPFPSGHGHPVLQGPRGLVHADDPHHQAWPLPQPRRPRADGLPDRRRGRLGRDHARVDEAVVGGPVAPAAGLPGALPHHRGLLAPPDHGALLAARRARRGRGAGVSGRRLSGRRHRLTSHRAVQSAGGGTD
mmetsp:Transcript_99369/g.267037  ORF Transcript_99369/g.267037 Transcript_99369/m.267037 type:complete len:209 (-) Transcript_99369:144-770(-)